MRVAERVLDAMQPPTPAYDEGVVHPAQVQGGEIEGATGLGVGVVEHLEAPVEEETVDAVGPHPTAHLVGGLEHGHVETRPVQLPRTAEPGQPGTDHDHVMTSSSHEPMLPPNW